MFSPQTMSADILSNAICKIATEIIAGGEGADFRRVLEKSNILNDVITVLIGEEKALVYQPLGQCYNLSYTPGLYGHSLYDEIRVVLINPAPVCSDHITPNTTSTLTLHRYFDSVRRKAKMEIPASVVHEIKELQSRMASFDPADGEDDRQLVLDSDIDEYVDDTLKELEKCFFVPAYSLKDSIEKGVTDQAVVTLSQTSIPWSLQAVVDKFQTTLTTTKVPGEWDRNEELMEVLCKEYAETACKNVYALAKAPREFLSALVHMGEKSIRKVAKLASDDLVLDAVTGQTLEFAGVIAISQKAYSALISGAAKQDIREGILVARKPAFFKPMPDVTKKKDMKVVMLYDEQTPRKNLLDRSSGIMELIAAAENGAKLAPGRVSGKGVLNLAELGKEVLSGRGIEERESTKERFRLGTHDVTTTCSFYARGERAYVMQVVREYNPVTDEPDPYGRTPSLVDQKKHIFRVSMGDFDDRHPQLFRWIARVCAGGDEKNIATDVDPRALFGVPDVTVHTPGVYPRTLKFSTQDMGYAFDDPKLYDLGALRDLINANIASLGGGQYDGTHLATSLFTRMLTIAGQAEDLFKTYVTSLNPAGEPQGQGLRAMIDLQKIELGPFFQVSREAIAGNRYRIALARRFFYGQMPLLGIHVIRYRALCFLAQSMSPNRIAAINSSLERLTIEPQPGGGQEWSLANAQDRDKVKEVARAFIGAASDLFEKHTPPFKVAFVFRTGLKQADDTPLADPNWVLYAYGVVPVITQMKVCPSENNADWPTGKVEAPQVVGSTGDPIFGYFDRSKLLPAENRHVFSAWTHYIVRKTTWPPVLKIAALITQYMYTDRIAIEACLREGIHPGFSVDFFKQETLFSERAIFTKPGAYEMLLTPAGSKTEELSDGTVNVTASCDIMTVRNTLGAGALSAATIFPNVRGSTTSEMPNGRPALSLDFIARRKEDGLAELLEPLDRDARKVVRDSIDALGSSSSTREPDAFVAVVRPVCVAPCTEVLTPIAGLFEPLVRVPEVNPWKRFYATSAVSRNPYASALGGIYQMGFTPNNTSMDGFLLQTMCWPGRETPSPTTIALEELYNLGCDPGVLSPDEKSCVTLQTCCGRNRPTSVRSPPPRDNNDKGAPSHKDVPAVLGLAVPYTQSTCAKTLQDANGEHLIVAGGKTVSLTGPGYGPADFLTLSPFTIPPSTVIMD